MTNHAEDYFDHVAALKKHHGLNQNGTHAEIIVTEDMYSPWTWYIATFGDYDLDCTYGSGCTPLDAIVDLLDQVEG